MKKPCKVVMLPTNKKSKLVIDSGKLRITPYEYHDWKIF